MCGLYLLVFVAMGLPELFRLLLLYLDEHRVSVATMVEVGIVSTLLIDCHFRPTPLPNRGVRAKQI